jgi:hypothetical protein
MGCSAFEEYAFHQQRAEVRKKITDEFVTPR